MLHDCLLHGVGCIGLLVLGMTLLTGCGPRYQITETRTPLTIGSTTIDVVVFEAEAPGLTFINLHDNEDTSAQAALKVMEQQGGRLIELQHTGERNVEFMLDDSTYIFDPNRIFTDIGVAATLDTLGAYSDSAHALVRQFGERLVELYELNNLDVVVTVHNNGETEYSALSYTPGGDYAEDASAANVVEGSDPDDFFFVTDEALYDTIRQSEHNVVLQDNARVTDDGSLSVYCGHLGIAYVNVEAQHGHMDEQVHMIEYLRSVLRPAS
ncbi:MAG TPA: hypothetical protein VKP65_09285 [Rhodothermales bacterium]|nr:hypothetical protein [Rhodothermales bacterium]